MLVYDIIPPKRKHPCRQERRSRALNKALTLLTLLAILLQTATGLFGAPKEIKAAGTTYYVDNCVTVGNDSANGTSPATPWLTIAKVNGKSFSPGDSILFEKGCTWREQLIVPSSGSAGNPITFGAYGSGAMPIISGSNIATSTSWTLEAESGTNFTSDSNIQAYYYMEEATGTRSDGTANHNDLTDHNSTAQSTTHIQGSYSASLTRASSQYLSRTDANLSSGFVGKSGSTNTEFTVGGWIYLTATGTNMIAFSKGDNNNHDSFLFQYVGADNRYRLLATLDGADHGLENDSSLSPNAWYHVVLRLTSSTKKLEGFINDAKQSSSYTATSSTVFTGGQILAVGALNGPVSYFGGLIDKVFVFNRALTDIEIANVYTYGLDGSRGAFTTYYQTGFSQPNQVFENGVRMTVASSKTSMTPGSWWWDSANSRVYVRATGDVNPSTETIEVSQRSRAATGNNQNYLSFSGLQFQEANGQGLSLSGSSDSNVTVSGNIFTLNYENGLLASPSPGVDDSLTITANTSSYNGADGFGFFQVENSLISGNSSYGNAVLSTVTSTTDDQRNSAGIRLGTTSSTNNIIERNLVYNNGPSSYPGTGSEGDGIWLDTAGTGNIVRYNRVYNNFGYDAGIMNEASSGETYEYNVVYGNGTSTSRSSGIWIDADNNNSSASNLVYGNTVYGNYKGISINSTQLAGDNALNNVVENNISVGNLGVQLDADAGGDNSGTYGSGNVYTYNDFGSQATNFIEWGSGVYKSTYAAFDSAYGSSTRSVAGDPKFTNPASNDFTLQSSSPAIDAGAELGSTYAQGLNPSSAWPSNVTLLDQYANGTSWDIGAYIYTESTPPTVLLIAPASGATVVGTTTVSATASDDTSVSSVQFKLDGVNLGFAATSVPYGVAWDTTIASDGSHTLSAVAKNTYGNYATSSIVVTVHNAPALTPTPTPIPGGGTILPPSSGMTYATPVPSPMPIVSPAENPPSATLLPSPFPSSSAAPSAEPSPVSPPSISDSILTTHLVYGSRGEQVTLLQQYLQNLGFLAGSFTPGIFDIPTLKAVKAFQTSQGIYPNGIVGPRTRKAIQDQEFVSNKDHVFTQDLALGSRGDEVQQLQTRLRDTNFYSFWLPSTGWFGPVTKEAVRIFQSFANILQTGRLDEATRGVLNVGGK